MAMEHDMDRAKEQPSRCIDCRHLEEPVDLSLAMCRDPSKVLRSS